MIPANRQKLEIRVVRAAEAALEAQNYVRPIDVLLGIGWLDPGAEKRWRQGQINYLERAVQANLNIHARRDGSLWESCPVHCSPQSV